MEEPEIPLLPDLDLKVEEDGLLTEESKDPVEKQEEFPKQDSAASEDVDVKEDKMLYVAIPIEDDVKLLQECYAALGHRIDTTKKLKRGSKKQSKIPERHPAPLELNDPIICDICEEFYKNNVAFALHSIKHSSDNKYYCHLCNYKNTSKYHIEMHVRVHEGTTRYKCEVCHKAFTISTHAKEHKYFHTGEKPFQCELCGKKFMFSWFLTSHRRTQHWELVTGKPLVKYDCVTCKKHYTSSTGLKRHNMYHHGTSRGSQNTALCDICGKILSSKEKLKFHTRIHTGYKPHACSFCPKCFSKKEQLKEHLRVHTGERPYLCKVCNKGFTQRSPLRIHERIHTGERPYICPICEKSFISKSAKDVHLKRCEVAKSLYEEQCRKDLEAYKQKLKSLEFNAKRICQTESVNNVKKLKKCEFNNNLMNVKKDCLDYYLREMQWKSNINQSEIGESAVLDDEDFDTMLLNLPENKEHERANPKETPNTAVDENIGDSENIETQSG